ncbi:MAG: HIT family protein [Clostridiales bacterium]|nr:HIT family protein [Clostridiales bacterium]
MSECMYCAKNDAQKEIMIYICDLEVSELYLFKNQAAKGRVIVAAKEHINEFHDLDEKTAAAFALDMRTAALAVSKAFSPDKINLGMYNDNGRHLHCHIVPKYKGGVNFGTTFEMNPQPPVILSDDEYKEIIEKIKEQL